MLKPCPFCGKPPTTEQSKGKFSAMVGCTNKLCALQPTALSRDVALAKAFWNTRA